METLENTDGLQFAFGAEAVAYLFVRGWTTIDSGMYWRLMERNGYYKLITRRGFLDWIAVDQN